MNGIEHFTSITRLTLSNNQLSGEIPSGLSSLTELYRLYLFKNELEGEISEKISNLTNLELLDLSYNQLSGEVPATIADIPCLGSMYLQHNHFTSIPLKAANKLIDMMNNGLTAVVYSVANQNYTEKINEIGTVNNTFAFERVIALYELIRPDGIAKEFVPTFNNGKFIINAQDLTQIGDYKFIATVGYIEGSIFNNEYEGNGVRELEYISVFSMNDKIVPTIPDSETPESEENTDIVTKSLTLPQTGTTNTLTAILILVTGLIIFSGNIVMKKRKE